MNERLIATLASLRNDPAVAAYLYEELFNGHYWTLAWRADMEASGYVGCQRADGRWEIPIFTQPHRSYLTRSAVEIPAAERVSVEGRRLWGQLLNDYLDDGVTRVVVDPGESHGIFLGRAMILGMVNRYGIVSDRDP